MNDPIMPAEPANQPGAGQTPLTQGSGTCAPITQVSGSESSVAGEQTTTNESPSHDLRPPWRRQAGMLIASQAVSLLGSAVVQYAMIWHVILVTKSGTAMAMATVAAFLPTVFLSPLAGVWADRYNRRVLVVAADGLTALATAVIMVCFLAGYNGLVGIYLVLLVRACSGAVQSPAITALTPSFVPADQLLRVNSLASSIQYLGAVLGPALAGLLLSLWPLPAVFAVDIVTAFIGIVMFWYGVRVDGQPPHSGVGAKWYRELAQGVSYTAAHRVIRAVIGLMALALFFYAAPGLLSNLYVAQHFGPEPWRLSVGETLAGIGAVLGGLVLAVWKGFRRETDTVALALLSLSAGILTLALAPNFVVFVAGMALAGFSLPFISSPLVTLLQKRSKPAHLGKVMSLVAMVNGTAIPLGMAVFGPLAHALSIPMIMFLGVVVEAALAFLLWTLPMFRMVEPHNPQPNVSNQT